MVLMQVDSLSSSEEVLCGQYNMRPIHAGGKDENLEGRRHSVGHKVPQTGITGTHFHPRDMGCIIEITEQHPAEDWLWWVLSGPLVGHS